MATDDDHQAPNAALSPLRSAVETWLQYSLASESLVHLTHEGLHFALNAPHIYRTLSYGATKVQRAEWKAEQARREIDAGFPNLHAHTLLGLYGALECFVEDVFVAMIRSNPNLLKSEAFSRMRLPASLLFDSDDETKYAAIRAEASRSTNADLSTGASKYEKLLTLVGLDGPVPIAIRQALYYGQQIRNAWAHRGGIADKKFVTNCPNLGYEVGDKVNMSPELFLSLMHGTHMYGVVIGNRDCDLRGQPRIEAECPGYEGCLSEVPARA